ncbi:MAG: sigma-70 family RNA polymerase sigma factor [Actinomycetota bacterium]|nr:sigma-70 family RNA polymerase sigma factor [Actinomycetota bacterium]
MLGGTLQLHDVRDAERLARSVIGKYERQGAARGERGRCYIREADRDDAVAFLVAEVWRAAKRFDAARFGGRPFSAFAVQVAHRRLIDWLRLTYGSSRYLTPPVFVSLEALGADLPDDGALDRHEDDSLVDLDELTPAARDLFVVALEALGEGRRDQDSISPRALARRTGGPQAQVASALKNMRDEIRAQLEQEHVRP